MGAKPELARTSPSARYGKLQRETRRSVSLRSSTTSRQKCCTGRTSR